MPSAGGRLETAEPYSQTCAPQKAVRRPFIAARKVLIPCAAPSWPYAPALCIEHALLCPNAELFQTLQITSAAARIVGAPVPPDTPLMQAGMDSLGAVELRRELAAALGVPRA